MKYMKMAIPPGVKWHGTAYQCSDRWHDANLMRWDQGAMLPVGGWVQYTTKKPGTWNNTWVIEPVEIPDAELPRESHSWFRSEATKADEAGYFLAVACPKNVYVMSGDGDIKNLTENVTLPGSENSSLNKGYGGGAYGMETYGTPRNAEGLAKIPPTTWALDNYGEWLLAVSTTDQRIWVWKPADDTFEPLDGNNVPRCLSLVATEERFIFALGASQNGLINVRRVAWCDREDEKEWVAGSNNEAGGFELQTDGAIRCGIRVRGRTLILTTTDAHTATYSGPPLVYGFQQVGKNCGVISDRAAAATGAGAFWMGRDGFYTYDGSAVRELPCEVSDRVFRFMDSSSYHNVFAVANAKFNEIVWFYTSRDQEGEPVVINPQDPPEDQITELRKANNRYVSYDYAQGVWSIGEINRHVGVDTGVFNDPIWIDAYGRVWRHEIENANHELARWKSDRWDGWTSPDGGDFIFRSAGYESHIGGEHGSDTEYLVLENGTSSAGGDFDFWDKTHVVNLTAVTDTYECPSTEMKGCTVTWDPLIQFDKLADVDVGAVIATLHLYQGKKLIHETKYKVDTATGYLKNYTDLQIYIPDVSKPVRVEFTPHKDFARSHNGWMLLRLQNLDYRSNLYPWAETGPISIGEGDQVIKATQLLADSIPVGRVTATFKTRFEPQGEERVHGPYELQPKTDVRFTGRQMRMRIDVKDTEDGNKDVRIGDMRVGVAGGGSR